MKTIDALIEIDWFANVGAPVPNTLDDVVRVPNWDEAIQKCSIPNWENVCLEARNDLTMHLNSVCKAEFQDWNNVIDEAKQLLAGSWERMQAYLDKQNLPSIIADCARWDTMNAVATEHFAKWNPPQFYNTLSIVYQCGRFPCGWSGEWPNGQLCIF